MQDSHAEIRDLYYSSAASDPGQHSRTLQTRKAEEIEAVDVEFDVASAMILKDV